jgi:hypothetical protein
MPIPSEQGRLKEQEQQPYYLASRFPSKQAAEQPYFAVQTTLHEMECDLSAYRFMRQWEEPNEKPWYVLVIGEQPAAEVEHHITTVLSQGEFATVPPEAVAWLMDRRKEQQHYGSWVEGHYTEQGKGIRYTEIKFSRQPKGKGQRRRH